MAVVAVIDLRRICDCAVGIVDLKAGRIDAAARDRTCAVLLIGNRIVAAKCIADARVLHRAAARIRVCSECGCRTAIAVAARDTGRRESCSRDAVCVKDRTGEIVVERVDRDIAVCRRTIIDLARCTKSDGDRARCNLAKSCERLSRCHRGRRRLRGKGVVLRLSSVCNLELCRVCHVLRRRCAAGVNNIFRCVLRRRYICHSIARNDPADGHEVISGDDMTVAVRLLTHGIVDLCDGAVLHRRRQCLRRDLTRTECIECICHWCTRTVRIQDIIVAKLIKRRIIALRFYIVGDLCRLCDVFRTRYAVTLFELCTAAHQLERDMSLITRNNPRIAARPCIRGEVEIGARRIVLRAVIDLLRRDLGICCLVIDLERIA